MRKLLLACLILIAWAPAPAPLMTRWGAELDPRNVLSEYPRPQMVRPEWLNLNGLWSYEIPGTRRNGQILVPFPIESALSGVKAPLGPTRRLVYRTRFQLPESWLERRVLLHFDAVDWDATVTVNGEVVGRHQGGYDPFELEFSPRRDNELTVSVTDPTDQGQQPRGKQVEKPRGIWYTPVSGIWQTVWVEPVPRSQAIRRLKIVPDVDRSAVHVTVVTEGSSPVTLETAGQVLAGASNAPITVQVANPRLWSPEDPHLYDLVVSTPSDRVQSYYGMRKISLGQDDHGDTRIMLNDRPLFQYGLLDQGWWPDGLYTAPSDAALKYDLEVTRRLGFNMVRKHVKTEPDRWYFWCDKMGLLVWQDMPSGGPEAPWKPEGQFDRTELKRSAEVARTYEREWSAIIAALENHPSIVMWVPFNEGWGQFETERITRWTEELDPTRLVNPASGGNDFPVGHVVDIHRYPGPASPPKEAGRAIVLGEFGGLGLPIPGHLWQNRDNWGYRTYSSREELTRAYLDLTEKLAREPGLSAAVYTQTTDVEGEVNGLLTYDRAVLKLDEEIVRQANLRVIGKN